MKIIWLCNSRFSENGLRETGTWLQPLANLVHGIEGTEIVNITFGPFDTPLTEDVLGIKQYILPQKDRKDTRITGSRLQEIIDGERPDLVHIWGTENVWGKLYVEGYIKRPAFLEMQGMKSYYYYYYGGLTQKELIKCNLAPMSLYAPKSSLFLARRLFKKDGGEEVKVLKQFNQISVQSRWVEDHVLAINPHVKIYHTNIILREPFYSCMPWEWKEADHPPVLFSTSSSSTPYKGMHVLIRAVAELKKKYPEIKLNIAGSFLGRKGAFFSSGYSRFLLGLIKDLGVMDNIRFLGSLNAIEIIEQLQKADVCVIPSFIETYCVALAEAMMVGTPCVVSYAGAMPEFAVANEEALFYTSSDHVSCAARINDCLTNRSLSEKLSVNGHKRKLQDCNKEKMKEKQMDNYRNILKDSIWGGNSKT